MSALFSPHSILLHVTHMQPPPHMKTSAAGNDPRATTASSVVRRNDINVSKRRRSQKSRRAKPLFVQKMRPPTGAAQRSDEPFFLDFASRGAGWTKRFGPPWRKGSIDPSASRKRRQLTGLTERPNEHPKHVDKCLAKLPGTVGLINPVRRQNAHAEYDESAHSSLFALSGLRTVRSISY
jgi:hypothetical protein